MSVNKKITLIKCFLLYIINNCKFFFYKTFSNFLMIDTNVNEKLLIEETKEKLLEVHKQIQHLLCVLKNEHAESCIFL